MDTMGTDRLIDDYLSRLEHAAAHMQQARRTELITEIRGHIDTPLRQEQAAGEPAVRNVLERLGPPEDIVDAAEPRPTETVRRAGPLEIAALIALIVPLIGWLIGAVLVFASRVWSRRNKVIGGLVLLVPIAILSLGYIAAGPNGGEDSVPPGDTRPVGERTEEPISESGPVELVALMAGLPSALYLGWQLRRDPGTSPTQS